MTDYRTGVSLMTWLIRYRIKGMQLRRSFDRVEVLTTAVGCRSCND